jgi:SPP1 family predicted phage head-tail adaptor
VLRERANVTAVFENYSLAQDAAGEEVKSWATLATRQALMLPMSGSQASERSATHTLSIRHVSGLTREHRVLLDSRHYEIHDVIDVDTDGREHVVRIREIEAN